MDTDITARLDRIEGTLAAFQDMLAALLERQTVKEFYEIDEFAKIVGKAPFTVREWARLGRIKATKRRSGRGAFAAWVVSHTELLRYQQDGLLPLPRNGV